jgi:hypothetical protein
MTPTMSLKNSGELAKLFAAVAERAKKSEKFAGVDVTAEGVECRALQAPEDAAFRVRIEGGKLFVSWVTGDRYMSQSVEADLMWTGDDLGELIAEELADLGWSGPPLGKVEHFRSEDKLFTFRSEIPAAKANSVDALAQALHAYEAAFSNLGDMKPEEDE